MPHDLSGMRQRIRECDLRDEKLILAGLEADLEQYKAAREPVGRNAAMLVEAIRAQKAPTMMESFLNEYGLSTKEGVALMCLAEALLRVPDDQTIDALISDKISPSAWGAHLGRASSSLVNASTWALMLTGSVLAKNEEHGLVSSLRGMVKRLGEPVIRTAVSQAMRELGRQFVLGRNIDEAMERAVGMEAKGYRYSYDMLGEAARTEKDAKRYHIAYSDAIASIAKQAKHDDIRANPGISIKLSALHPRYEMAKKDRLMDELTARAGALALIAKSANIGLNIDAEEADRLDLSLDIIQAVFEDPALKDWAGFGVVVQAYGRRAGPVIDWIYALAQKHNRPIMVRLVKGAYWDTEIKRAQVLGLQSFPVFTRKAATDVSYIACAAKLLGMTDLIYPQFATHNAHSMAAILEIAGDDRDRFEFQRLHGMGDALHEHVQGTFGTKTRIYAPVGAHQDLLAYLVRRLLENGANSSFVNQITDKSVDPTAIAADPYDQLGHDVVNGNIKTPAEIFGDERRNSKGFDLTSPFDLATLQSKREAFLNQHFQASPMIGEGSQSGAKRLVRNPARPEHIVGTVFEAERDQAAEAAKIAGDGAKKWADIEPWSRREILSAIGGLYEEHCEELMAICCLEAGKTMMDALGEVREAVDFCRYYAGHVTECTVPGVIACISPWNFPLAIFTGQITGALAAGNAVIAKPAEQTPLIAARAIALMHQAGVPKSTLQFLPGTGSIIGRALVEDPAVSGVCFTGSTETAKIIAQSMADHLSPDSSLIAETGGLNAMIMDSTALPEQAVRDIVISAFQSSGQRCSALRILYVQSDVADRLIDMLKGAMDCLELGDPWQLRHDIGPLIDEDARSTIDRYVEAKRQEGRLIKQLAAPSEGHFVGPAIIRVSGIHELEREVFGPVLHIAVYEAEDLIEVVDQINARGYGLTLGIHTRIDDRVQTIVERAKVGNIYVNRNQIGAVVGSQPFGGEGLSGTGPKAGGPDYVDAMRCSDQRLDLDDWVDAGTASYASFKDIQTAIGCLRPKFEDWELSTLELPGPTGESNRLSVHPRGVILCVGDDQTRVARLVDKARASGNLAVALAPDFKPSSDPLTVHINGTLDPNFLENLKGIDGVAVDTRTRDMRAIRQAIARRPGAILPLILPYHSDARYRLERHLCIDTTAAGGNASLLAEVNE